MVQRPHNHKTWIWMLMVKTQIKIRCTPLSTEDSYKDQTLTAVTRKHTKTTKSYTNPN